MRHRRGAAFVLVLASLGLVAASCGSSSKKSSSGGGPTTTVAAKQGGDLVVSAEQEPDCMDWIGSCAGAAWGLYTAGINTMPRPYFFSDKNTYVPSPMLTGEATVVTSPKLVVTYHINPKAVWSDGQPITSTDMWYTWDQIVHGKDIYDTTGYANIESVDHTDPHTAIVTFQQGKPYADWKGLWSGLYGTFPAHILQGQDRDAMTKDGYKWSGGPWMIDHWTKGVELKLVPNPTYWDKKPNLASVTFKFITDTAAEVQAVKSGQVLAAYPQAQPDEVQLKGLPGVSFDAISGLSYEGLWFQTQKAPLTSKAVRQALAYATDRAAIVTQLFGPIQPDIKPIQSVATPAFGQFYTDAYSQYTLDLNKVTSLMTGDGWAKGADGIWAKGGQKANLELKTTTGNKRRLLTAQILQSQWKAAGFNLTLTTEKAGVLFGQDGPSGNFQVALYAQTPNDNDPGLCVLWCSQNIPTAANGNTGENWYRISDPNLDKYWGDADINLDQSVRLTDVTNGEKTLADLVPVLPLDPFPDINVVNTDRVGSQIGFIHNFSYSQYAYLNYWFMK